MPGFHIKRYISRALSRLRTVMDSRIPSGSQKLGSLFRNERGAAAIEIAFLAPLVVGGALALGHIGLGIHDRIQLGQIINAGAAIAANDNPGMDGVRQRMVEVATAKGYAVADQPNTIGEIVMTVTTACFCGNDLSNATNCWALCPNGRSAGMQYRLQTNYINPVSHKLFYALANLRWPYIRVSGDIRLNRDIVVR